MIASVPINIEVCTYAVYGVIRVPVRTMNQCGLVRVRVDQESERDNCHDDVSVC